MSCAIKLIAMIDDPHSFYRVSQHHQSSNHKHPLKLKGTINMRRTMFECIFKTRSVVDQMKDHQPLYQFIYHFNLCSRSNQSIHAIF
jgi:hypothetical protein